VSPVAADDCYYDQVNNQAADLRNFTEAYINTCQYQCFIDPNCVFFVFERPSATCHLKAEPGTGKSSINPYFITGPKNCQRKMGKI
jgi:hypothetical protein